MSKELDLLGALNERIRRGVASAQDAALALEQVHRDRIYLQTHPSFEAYCVEEFGFSVATGKRMVSEARKMLNPVVSTAQDEPFALEIEAPKGKAKAIETTAVETDQKDRGHIETQATLLDLTVKAELAEARKKIAQLEKALDVRLSKPAKPIDTAARLEALELENQLLRDELERPLQGSVVHVAPPEADFMAQLAEALEMSLDHPPATLLIKVRSLMTERAKRKPAKKADQPLAAVRSLPTTRPPATRRDVEPMFKKGAR